MIAFEVVTIGVAVAGSAAAVVSYLRGGGPLEELEEGTIVMLLADSGWKYLSTGIYDRPLEDLDEPLERSLLW